MLWQQRPGFSPPRQRKKAIYERLLWVYERLPAYLSSGRVLQAKSAPSQSTSTSPRSPSINSMMSKPRNFPESLTHVGLTGSSHRKNSPGYGRQSRSRCWREYLMIPKGGNVCERDLPLRHHETLTPDRPVASKRKLARALYGVAEGSHTPAQTPYTPFLVLESPGVVTTYQAGERLLYARVDKYGSCTAARFPSGSRCRAAQRARR
jgi:hypothetical protein